MRKRRDAWTEEERKVLLEERAVLTKARQKILRNRERPCY
jgi:hypothetical protein